MRAFISRSCREDIKCNLFALQQPIQPRRNSLGYRFGRVRNYGQVNLYHSVSSPIASFLSPRPFERSSWAARACSQSSHPLSRRSISSSSCTARNRTWARRRPFSTSTVNFDFPKIMGKDKAYIALGSNVGDRLANLEDALAELEASGVHVTRTSNLYETAPMYVRDQASFYNAVCEVDIPESMTPLSMLDLVKTLENKLGRVKTIEKGPRAIDLDILAFGQETVAHERLSIPHHSILEREFVLRPLADLVPDFCLPGHGGEQVVASYLSALPREIHTSITPLKNSLPSLKPGLSSKKTHVMGIFNMTPDSFSDGGRNSLDPTSEQMQTQLSAWLEAGATILDIGGQSTAPNAEQITAEEELARVLPLIKHIRSKPRFDNVAISIDTFRASVAEAAVRAGADIVNDVSAGAMDPDMFPTVARLRVPIILMHMRGDSKTMQTMCDYPDGLLPTIAHELGQRLEVAMEAGIPRWRIILDPGVGFAKAKGQNAEIIRDMDKLMNMDEVKGFPWLVGTSRKRWIGHVLGIERAENRDWATAATVAANVATGVDIVRVHNEKLAQTAALADAIWRDSHEW